MVKIAAQHINPVIGVEEVGGIGNQRNDGQILITRAVSVANKVGGSFHLGGFSLGLVINGLPSTLPPFTPNILLISRGFTNP